MPPSELTILGDRALHRLRQASPDHARHLEEPDLAARLRRVALASDFAIDTLVRQPELLSRWGSDPAPGVLPPLNPERREEWPALLRRYRAAESTRLVWRDVLGMDAVGDTLAGATRLAEDCLAQALSALEDDFARRHGILRGADGQPQRLVVFGLGKLGGGELNFSSDIDLVYAYESDGESDGPRPLAAEAYFARLGQQLAKLLDEVTADGFSHRVDLRLRPYGNAGRVAWSFAAMEQYFQQEGRDWERYAWQKARPVAGDIAAGERFLDTLRPFVYRRYLDYGALDGLRAMKAAISAEVARKELADDIKRGPGGIREIEFLVQALQLIRGGREPALRERRLVPALRALAEGGHLAGDTAASLEEAYAWLRRLENRLQMLRDAQTHQLPASDLDKLRLAASLGYEDWSALRRELDAHRARVSAEFDALLAARERSSAPDALGAYWRALPEGGEPDVLLRAGFAEAQAADGLLRDLARSPVVRGLPDAARARLDHVLPALLQGAAGSQTPMLALRRLLPLLQNILRRSAYLALLQEQPAALQRLVETVSHSALLAERLAAYPLLLDELLDARVAGPLPGRDTLLQTCTVTGNEPDTESALQQLNEVRQALSFRIAMAVRDRRQPAADSARQLAWLADGVVACVLRIAQREIEAAHGRVPGARFAIVGYGSLGGEELGFGSDLDLVFLYDLPEGTSAAEAHSDGPRPLDAARWFARLAQKVVALLGAVTAAGRLYDVDVRLRPDGAKGLLVSSLASFTEYQRDRAWTWEHQALVRARCVAGDEALCAGFERVRAGTLARGRNAAAVNAAAVNADVVAMRRRMRAELDRSDAAAFDLKQGEGALVDLEFLLQALVLACASRMPALLVPRNTPALIAAMGEAGLFDGEEVARLCDAHATMLSRGLACTLDRRPRREPLDAALEQARAAIRAAARAKGLDFGQPATVPESPSEASPRSPAGAPAGWPAGSRGDGAASGS